MKQYFRCLILLFAFTTFSGANAASLMFDINTFTSPGYVCADCTVGYEFTLTEATTIRAMGVYDHSFDGTLDGLNSAHEVGLWDSVGTLLASTTISNSSVAVPSVVTTPFPGQWLFENISAVNLIAGTYTAGVLQTGTSEGAGGDIAVRGVATTFNLPGSLGTEGLFGNFSGDGTLSRPDTSAGAGPFLGPNLSTTSVGVVPVPAAAWLFASALGLLGWIRRKTA